MCALSDSYGKNTNDAGPHHGAAGMPGCCARCSRKWAKAGANVPLLGFGNNLWKGVKEMVDKEGFLGIFLGGFKNCAAGLSAALVFSYIASLITQPKMKKH